MPKSTHGCCKSCVPISCPLTFPFPPMLKFYEDRGACSFVRRMKKRRGLQGELDEEGKESKKEEEHLQSRRRRREDRQTQTQRFQSADSLQMGDRCGRSSARETQVLWRVRGVSSPIFQPHKRFGLLSSLVACLSQLSPSLPSRISGRTLTSLFWFWYCGGRLGVGLGGGSCAEDADPGPDFLLASSSAACLFFAWSFASPDP